MDADFYNKLKKEEQRLLKRLEAIRLLLGDDSGDDNGKINDSDDPPQKKQHKQKVYDIIKELGKADVQQISKRLMEKYPAIKSKRAYEIATYYASQLKNVDKTITAKTDGNRNIYSVK